MHCWYPWITTCLRSGQAVRGQRPFLIFLGDVCSHYSLDVHKPLSITSLSYFWILADLDNCCFQLDWTKMTCLKSRLIPDPKRFITFSWVNVGIHACLCVYQPLRWSKTAFRLMYTPTLHIMGFTLPRVCSLPLQAFPDDFFASVRSSWR